MDINSIKNETLAKLTAEEIGELGLLNLGVMTYRGELKSRRQGFKTEKVSEIQTNFNHIGYPFTVEFIKIQQTGDTEEWAMRVYYPDKGYNIHLIPLAGIDFLK